MKKVLKIGLIFITVFVLLCQFGCVNAAIMDLNPEEYNPGEIGINEDVLIFPKILGVIQVVGIILSVLILMIIGIKEMIGSVEEKSKIKDALPGYIMGVLLIASMTTLPNIIYNFMKK